MVIFVRHGTTASNEPGNEKLRGWLPIPLNLAGMKESHDTAESLAVVENVKELMCGTLVRVIQSANEIAEVLGMELTPLEELNDWDTGDFAGEDATKARADLHDRIDNPNKAVPGGETFQFFLDRITPLLTKYVESEDVYILVSSGRVGTLLKALSVNDGSHPDTPTLKGKPPIDPAGIMIVRADWNIPFMTRKTEETKGLS